MFTLVVDFTFYLQLLSCVFFPPLMFPLIKYVEEETQDPSNIGTDNDPGAKPTKVGTTTCIYGEQYNYPLANEVAKGYSNATVRPSFRPSHPCEHSRINILQWILTKLGTYLVLKRIWNPVDFQGHRSKVKVTGSNFYRIISL